MGRRGNTPGRLLREENPQSGTVPGFTPQYFEDDRHPREVSEDYPYPVKDSSVDDKLADLIDKQSELIEKQGKIIDRLNEPLDTKLTGRSVGEGEAVGEHVDPGMSMSLEPEENDGFYELQAVFISESNLNEDDLRVTVDGSDDPNGFSFTTYPSLFSFELKMTNENIRRTGVSRAYLSEKITVPADYYRFSYENTSDEQQQFRGIHVRRYY